MSPEACGRQTARPSRRRTTQCRQGGRDDDEVGHAPRPAEGPQSTWRPSASRPVQRYEERAAGTAGRPRDPHEGPTSRSGTELVLARGASPRPLGRPGSRGQPRTIGIWKHQPSGVAGARGRDEHQENARSATNQRRHSGRVLFGAVPELASFASRIVVRATLDHRPLRVGVVFCVWRVERVVLPRDPRVLRMSGSHARLFPAGVIRNAETTAAREALCAALVRRRRSDPAALNVAGRFSTPAMR